VEDRRIKCLVEAGGALHHGIEHGVEVGGRARDDAGDLAGGALLLTCLGVGRPSGIAWEAGLQVFNEVFWC
jgi:hypothetical protein